MIPDSALIEQKKRRVGRPSKQDIRERPENRCTGRSKRTQDQCMKTAGWGTDHKGVGPCKLHGGLTPKPAYVAATDSMEGLIQKYEHDPAIFDLRRDLATLRAIRDQEIKKFALAADGSKARAESINTLSVIINDIVRASTKFYDLISKQNFALTIAQAAQIRETMKLILAEETSVLAAIVSPISQGISDEILAWRKKVAQRLDNELRIEAKDVAVRSY